MFIGSIYCKQYGPRSDCSQGIRVHNVCFHYKIRSEVRLNICSRHKKQMTFSGQIYWQKDNWLIQEKCSNFRAFSVNLLLGLLSFSWGRST